MRQKRRRGRLRSIWWWWGLVCQEERAGGRRVRTGGELAVSSEESVPEGKVAEGGVAFKNADHANNQKDCKHRILSGSGAKSAREDATPSTERRTDRNAMVNGAT